MKIPSPISSSLLEFCSRFQFDAHPIRASRKQRPLEFQKLEPKVLLAGDVTVFVDSGFGLVIRGDDAANQIQIVGTDLAGARVIGLDGTTINGSNSEFLSGIGLRGMNVQLAGGADSIDIQNARYNFGVVVQGHGGNDHVRIRNSSIDGLDVQGGAGDDLVELDNVFVIHGSMLNMADGDDLIAVYNHAAGDNVTIRGGNGNDTLAAHQLGMFEALDLDMGSGNDNVLLSGETWVGQNSMLYLGTGNDFLGIMPEQGGSASQIQKNTMIDGGPGNDQVALDASVSAYDGTLFDGNQGSDGFNYSASGLVNPNIISFENAGFDVNSALDEVYRQLADEGLDPTRFGGSDSFILGIEINPIELNYTENDPALSVDPFLQLNGVASTVVTSATVTLEGFVAGQDIVEFLNVGSITGVFNDATGVLTFTGNANLSQYQLALRTVTYRNSSEAPAETDRNFRIDLNTADTSVTASRSLSVFQVNDIPQLSLTVDDLVFDIDDGDLDRPLVLDQNAMLTDPDGSNYQTATVTIFDGMRPGDVLAFAGGDGITGSFDANSGVLTLTGPGTVEDFEKAFRNVTFDNANERAPLGIRTIRFEVSDGQTLVTDQLLVDVIASQTVEVQTSPGEAEYLETDPPTPVDPGIILNIDNGDPGGKVDGATVVILSGYEASQDSLSFTELPGVTGNFDSGTGILTFTGEATAAEYQTLLRSVTFENSSFGDFDFSTADRVVQFNVTAGGLTENATRTIAVSEIPTDQALIERYLELNNMTSQVTSSGLHYIVTQEGDGNFPNENSTVTVNYVGTLLNGEEFDSNDDISFSLQQVIPGWTEGIPKFSRGGSGMLLIPSDLAYGEFPPPGIPPNAVLVFEVDLLDFTN